LAARLEGLPEGAHAAASAAQLLAEGGAGDAAGAAADRARLIAPDAALDALASRLRPPPAPAPPAALPSDLHAPWSQDLLISRLRPRPPFVQISSDEAPIAPVVPLVRDGVVYTCDSLSTEAVDLLSGRRLWHHTGPLEAIEQQHADDRWFSFDKYVD